MRLKKIIQAVVAAIIIASSTGCATIIIRPRGPRTDSGNFLFPELPPFYPATYVDYDSITAGYDRENWNAFEWAISKPLWVVDLPFSLLTDTLCLPSDLIHYRKAIRAMSEIELMKELSSPNPDRRGRAASRLGEIRSEVAVPDLIRLLSDDSRMSPTSLVGGNGMRVGESAADALSTITGRHFAYAQNKEEIAEWLEWLDSPDAMKYRKAKSIKEED